MVQRYVIFVFQFYLSLATTKWTLLVRCSRGKEKILIVRIPRLHWRDPPPPPPALVELPRDELLQASKSLPSSSRPSASSSRPPTGQTPPKHQLAAVLQQLEPPSCGLAGRTPQLELILQYEVHLQPEILHQLERLLAWKSSSTSRNAS